MLQAQSGLELDLPALPSECWHSRCYHHTCGLGLQQSWWLTQAWQLALAVPSPSALLSSVSTGNSLLSACLYPRSHPQTGGVPTPISNLNNLNCPGDCKHQMPWTGVTYLKSHQSSGHGQTSFGCTHTLKLSKYKMKPILFPPTRPADFFRSCPKPVHQVIHTTLPPELLWQSALAVGPTEGTLAH